MKAPVRLALIVATGALILGAQHGPAHAKKCINVGGWGTGVLRGFAASMAKAAMKNSAKAKLGDAVRIGAVAKKCEVKTLLYECTARARACT